MLIRGRWARRGTDPLLARALFWFTGHPIVYFWLLPAYISWYTLAPRQAGGKLFSDPLARTSFLLFLILSTPLGFHHQYTDPGIHTGWKLVHAFLTFAVFFPSLLTFFNVVASLESGARARGGRGWFAWFAKLPWGDPSLAAQVLAMLLFTFGGIGGLINASYNLNLVVHNTAWIVGHLHLTVGTAATLTFMGVSYWLVPHLTGHALWSRRLALWQVWLWFGGMIVFSNTLHRLGLMGMPRRTMIGAVPYIQPSGRRSCRSSAPARGPVPQLDALLPEPAADVGRLAVPGGRAAGVRGGDVRPGERAGHPRPLAAVDRDGLRADRGRLRPHAPAAGADDALQRAGLPGVVSGGRRA
jgi:heme/copper-type cytochrome/quinol oxidase subunit 1